MIWVAPSARDTDTAALEKTIADNMAEILES
jgi:hypothetical protein